MEYAFQVARERGKLPASLRPEAPKPAQINFRRQAEFLTFRTTEDAPRHAATLLRMMGAQPSSAADLMPGLQKHYGNRYVQRVVGLARAVNEGPHEESDVEAAIEQEPGSGQSLDHATRSEMGNAFGANFAGVRVHTDSKANALNQDVNAIAFTTGQDIFFSHGAYNPGTSGGRELLAHELTHVVQHGGPSIQPKLTVGNPDDAYEREATQVAKAVARSTESTAPEQEVSRCACGGTCEACSAGQSDRMDRLAVSGALQRQDAGEQPAPPTGGPPAPAPVPAGGCPPTEKIPRPDPRFISDNLCLLSNDLKDDTRLNDAFHNNPPLTAKDNGTDAVQKMQKGLLKVGESLEVNGNWDDQTIKAVASFQSKNHVPPGGFEAGRKTLKALDTRLQQPPPPAGGCTTQPPAKDPRAIFDNLCLLSDDLKDDSRLNDAVHNNPPLTAKDNGSDAVQKMQKGLLKLGEKLEVNGNWDDQTVKAVASFQSKNHIPPGGQEAGRKTLKALDDLLQQQPPPPPSQAVTVTAQCGQGAQAGTVIVNGSGFPPGEVDLAVDGVARAAALAGADKTFTANLKDDGNSHVVKATSGSVQQSAQFGCGGQGPTPTPLNPELETVLDRIEVAYQLMITRERDGVQAVVRDLTPLDIPDPSLATTVLRGLLQGSLTALYGASEGLLREAVNKATKNDPTASHQDTFVIDNTNDKVFDAMWQACTGLISDLLGQSGQQAAAARSNMLADFADNELSVVTQAGFTAFDKFERDGKNDLRSPAKGKLPPPPILAGEAATGGVPPSVTGDLRVDRARVMLNSVNTAAANAFKLHYQTALDRWDVELAKGSAGTKLKTGSFGGGQEQVGTEPIIDPSTGQPLKDPDTGQVITKPKMAAKQSLDLNPLKQNSITGAPPTVPPGVVDMLMLSGLPSGKVQVGPSSIDGLSPRTRQKLSELPVAQLGIPLVAQGTFRLPGPPLDDDFLLKAPVVVGINEVGFTFDLTTNSSGVEWLEDKGNGNRSAGVQKVADELKASKMSTLDKK